MVTKDFTVDLNKPLVFQVGHLGEAYDEWVHQPLVSKTGPRFFANDYAELLTLTKWWVIPLIWLPVASWFFLSSIQRGLSPQSTMMTAVCGIFVWSIVEYIIHRFIFHMKTTSYWGNTLHYFIHGFHHKHPMDSLRLVFPPALTTIAAIPLWSVVKLISTPTIAPALFGGGLIGYVLYDLTHYYLHYGRAYNEATQKMKKYHLDHHFKVQTMGYGVTSTFWDRIFGTFPTPKVASRN
ncbi:Dihydroceramide fatty acyl 2-hydroxylase FAH1-like protein [Drosera capensis]